MDAHRELERWQERQVDLYQRTQIIDHMSRQVEILGNVANTLTSTDRDLSSRDSGLEVVETHLEAVETHLGRLAAVADDTLPAIVGHLASTAARMNSIERILASPEETRAAELFRSGSRALSSARQLEESSPGLALEWLDDAIAELSRAVEIYQYHAESWFQLAIAHERKGSGEEAAAAFARSARFSLTDAPAFSAGALLLAAALYRNLQQLDRSETLLGRFVQPLEECAEIHLALALRHGQVHRLRKALAIVPMFAAEALLNEVAGAESVAAEYCEDEDSPVSRFRCLEHAVAKLVDAAAAAGITATGYRLTALPLQRLGLETLLKAEARLPEAVAMARKLEEKIRAHLRELKLTTEGIVQHAQAREKAARDERDRLITSAKSQAELTTSQATMRWENAISSAKHRAAEEEEARYIEKVQAIRRAEQQFSEAQTDARRTRNRSMSAGTSYDVAEQIREEAVARAHERYEQDRQAAEQLVPVEEIAQIRAQLKTTCAEIEIAREQELRQIQQGLEERLAAGQRAMESTLRAAQSEVEEAENRLQEAGELLTPPLGELATALAAATKPRRRLIPRFGQSAYAS